MSADIYTKAFADRVKWTEVCELMNIVEPTEICTVVSRIKACIPVAYAEEIPEFAPACPCVSVVGVGSGTTALEPNATTTTFERFLCM